MMPNRIPHLVLLALLCLGLLLSYQPPSAHAAGGTAIAFVRSTPSDGDQIWLTAPDGSGAHTIYAPGLAPYEQTHIGVVNWKPDATELAFTSDREATCSMWEYDVYSILPSGGGYRRITNGPDCASLAGYPKGSVTLLVENYNSLAPVIYFQGASKLEFGPAGGAGFVTFNDVADLGPMKQYPVALFSNSQRVPGVSGADVVPGKIVAVPNPLIVGTSYELTGAAWPSWNSSGDKLSYVWDFNTLRAIAARPGNLAWGDSITAPGATMPMIVTDLAWSPNPAHANELLYRSFDPDPPYNHIYRITVGSGNAGEVVVSRMTEGQDFMGLAWLPDGSGFVYSRTDPGIWGVTDHGNIYAYDFQTGESTPLTDFGTNDYPARLSVSPDGQQIVFERTTAKDRSEQIDLWVMNRDGSDMHLLASDARSPAWSPAALPSYRPTFLPLVRR